MRDFDSVPLDDAARRPNHRGVEHVSLTETLDLREMRSSCWFVSPGDELGPHRQREQEELYVVLDGPGRMRIDGEPMAVPERGAVRVAPETPRTVFNDTDRTHVWLVVGAPPVDDDGVPLHDEGGPE